MYIQHNLAEVVHMWPSRTVHLCKVSDMHGICCPSLPVVYNFCTVVYAVITHYIAISHGAYANSTVPIGQPG